jgi:hypothetical protein
VTAYERPIKATLHVHLENGESWEVTPLDLDKFNLVNRHEAYMVFDDVLTKVLTDAGLIGGDITEARLNPLRYLVETAVVHPDLLGHPDRNEWASVADVEHALQDHLANESAQAARSE